MKEFTHIFSNYFSGFVVYIEMFNLFGVYSGI